MGINIKANSQKYPMDMDGGYGMFATIRTQIAKDWYKPFGEHYEKQFTLLLQSDKKQWVEEAQKIIDPLPDDDIDVVEFLFMSDYEGKIGYKLCKKIYEIIKNDGVEFGLGYWHPMPDQKGIPFTEQKCEQLYDWSYFKELLLHCYKHRCNLVWN